MTEPFPDEIVLAVDLPDAPEKVWRALTEPELLAAWLGAGDFSPAKERFAVSAPELGGAIAAEVLAAEKPRRLRLAWRGKDGGQSFDTVVSFELSATPQGGTHLRLVHGGFALAAGEPVARPTRLDRTLASSFLEPRRIRNHLVLRARRPGRPTDIMSRRTTVLRSAA